MWDSGRIFVYDILICSKIKFDIFLTAEGGAGYTILVLLPRLASLTFRVS